MLYFRVENGFRFGRVTTIYRSAFSSGLSKMASDSEGLRLNPPPYTMILPSRSKMASDSEGLRPPTPLQATAFSRVENGFRFGRVTTFVYPGYLILILFLVENGFRFGRVTTSRKFLRHRLTLFCRKWLPIRKGYDTWLLV